VPAGASAGAVSPDGFGFTPGDCGVAYLWTNSNTRWFRIDLLSYDGDVTGGWYVMYTNGILSATQSGGIPGNEGTEPSMPGYVNVPGFYPSTATAYGIANTIEGPCVFYVVADWSPLD
jgi:hypothetical protein